MRLEPEELVRRYQDSVFHAAFSVCRNREDAEDVTQETFLACLGSGRDFESPEHLRAWLLRVAINKGRDLCRSFWRRNRQSLEELAEELPFSEPEDGEVLLAVLRLPEKYRVVIHLFYYEDYSVREIAGVLHISEGAVKVRLHRGRALLKDALGGMEP